VRVRRGFPAGSERVLTIGTEKVTTRVLLKRMELFGSAEGPDINAPGDNEGLL
jgi:hypothetical protein